MLSEEVANNWVTDDSQIGEITTEAFEKTRSKLLAFTARGYFAQVMQGDHHHRCYLKWQETFQIERLYKEVSDEIREMHGFLLMRYAQAEEQSSQRLEVIISLLGPVIGMTALTLSFFGMNLQGITTWNDGIRWYWGAGIVGVGVLLGMLISLLIRRQARRTAKK
jgi:hypothetical protein